MFDNLQMNEMFPDDQVEMIPILSVDEDDSTRKENLPPVLPILPLRNNVLFPGVVIPISVGRERSIKAVKKAFKENKYIGVVAQKDTSIDEPEEQDIYTVGTVARIIRMLNMPDGGNTLILQGVKRFEVKKIVAREPIMEAEVEYLDDVFLDAGAEWREAGCSMCLAMNPDKLAPGERSASTSNRNFEGRQGPGGRTHLVSPAVAAATAVTGRLTAPADLPPVA